MQKLVSNHKLKCEQASLVCNQIILENVFNLEMFIFRIYMSSCHGYFYERNTLIWMKLFDWVIKQPQTLE